MIRATIQNCYFVFQVYHMCNARGGGRGFLCPMLTKFNQKTMVCDFSKRVKCEQSGDFFHRNVIIHEASLAATKPSKTKKNKELNFIAEENFKNSMKTIFFKVSN